MKEFETVERCGRVHVVKNGVESAEFVMPNSAGRYIIFSPEPLGEWKTLGGALDCIARVDMDTWYTVKQAAEALVETGVFDEPPSPQLVGRWCREGLLPGAFKLQGKGGRGGGGAWRIPLAALEQFAERRKQ